MKTFKVVLIILISLLIFSGTAFFIIGYSKPKPGGIMVDTSPVSSVYVNGELAGKTPLQKTYDSGEIILKLVPLITDQSLLPFETKINLIPGVQTVVRREFGVDENSSSGDIISFEKQGGQNASLIVVSTPDNAQVTIDGVVRGFSPYKTSSISPAKHQITVKASGYSDRVMTINTVFGYQLDLFAKLSVSKTASDPTPTPTSSPVTQNYVEILSTPTGYLRVRTEPGTAGEEIAQVKPGDRFLYLGEDALTGWYKIQYEEPKAGLPNGISGWVSNQYSKIVDKLGQNIVSSPTPIPSPTLGPN